MAVTYEKIATNTLGSAAASVTFSSISSAYTDLVLICDTKATSGTPNLRLTFNGDTTTNYSSTVLAGNGTAAASARYSTIAYIGVDYYGYSDTTNQKNTIINIMNYANTTTFKTVLARANNAASGTDAIVGLWRKTPEAINSITLAASGSTYVSGSTFTLYGIKAA